MKSYDGDAEASFSLKSAQNIHQVPNHSCRSPPPKVYTQANCHEPSVSIKQLTVSYLSLGAPQLALSVQQCGLNMLPFPKAPYSLPPFLLVIIIIIFIALPHGAYIHTCKLNNIYLTLITSLMLWFFLKMGRKIAEDQNED